MEDLDEKQAFNRMSSQRRRKLWSLAARAAAKCPDEGEKMAAETAASPLEWSKDSLVKTQDSGVSMDVHSAEGLQCAGTMTTTASFTAGNSRTSFQVSLQNPDQKTSDVRKTRLPRQFYSEQTAYTLGTGSDVDTECPVRPERIKFGSFAVTTEPHYLPGISARHLLNPVRRGNPRRVAGGSADSSGLGSSLDWASVDVSHLPIRQFSSSHLQTPPTFYSAPKATRSFDETINVRQPMPKIGTGIRTAPKCGLIYDPRTGQLRRHFGRSLEQQSPQSQLITNRKPHYGYLYPTMRQRRSDQELSYFGDQRSSRHPSFTSGQQVQKEEPVMITVNPRSVSRSFDQAQQSLRRAQLLDVRTVSHDSAPGIIYRLQDPYPSPLLAGAAKSSMLSNVDTHCTIPVTLDYTNLEVPYKSSTETTYHQNPHTRQFLSVRSRTMEDRHRECELDQFSPSSLPSSGRRRTLTMHPVPPPTDEYEFETDVIDFRSHRPHLDRSQWLTSRSRTQRPVGSIRRSESVTEVSSSVKYSHPQHLKEYFPTSGAREPSSSVRSSQLYEGRHVSDHRIELAAYPDPCLQSIQQTQASRHGESRRPSRSIQPGRKRNFEAIDSPTPGLIPLPPGTCRTGQEKSDGFLMSTAAQKSPHPIRPVRPAHSSPRSLPLPSRQLDIGADAISMKLSSSDRPLVHPDYLRELTSPVIRKKYTQSEAGVKATLGTVRSDMPLDVPTGVHPRRLSSKVEKRMFKTESPRKQYDSQPKDQESMSPAVDGQEVNIHVARIIPPHSNNADRQPFVSHEPIKESSCATVIPVNVSLASSVLGYASTYPAGIKGQKEPPFTTLTPTRLPGPSTTARLTVGDPSKVTINIITSEVEEFSEYWDHNIFAKARIGAVGVASIASICLFCTVGASTWIYQGSGE
ncbi:hypothetical protein PHET_02709 [Paragonimus heterotremus]|uniref:Uncharacterized protein n=1 Tax=Paragonimus heterotremus TaxID=100268 RepID=A0A8J4TKV4_9TREM|nr:hypothetical protein PHET_02709 [Paragonimus heterotremus]